MRTSVAALAAVLLTASAWPTKRTVTDALMCLVRYDQPQGFQANGLRTVAKWTDGADPVHWPLIQLRNNLWFNLGDPGSSVSFTLFAEKRGCVGDSAGVWGGVPMEQHDDWEAYYRLPLSSDPYFFPGTHRIRNILGQGGIFITHTTDRTVKSEQLFFNTELFVFAVMLSSSAPLSILNVTLSYGGESIYALSSNGSAGFSSLTLQLPASEAWVPYVLSVNGGLPIAFHTGLVNVTVPNPEDVLILTNTTWEDEGGVTFALRSVAPEHGLDVSSVFYAASAWDADVRDAGNASIPEPFASNYSSRPAYGLTRHLNAGVPRAPIAAHAIALPAGMSGGFYFPNGQDSGAAKLYNETPTAWAALLAGVGFDFVAEQTQWLLEERDNAGGAWDAWATAMADAGVGFGLVPDSQDNPDRPFMAPEIAFYSATLPDFRGPLVRDVSLLARRFAAFPHFHGMSLGADNAGYVQYWNWAQNNPNRPFGEALEAFSAFRGTKAGKPYITNSSTDMLIPIAPSVGTDNEGIFRAAGNTSDMIDWLHDFDALYNTTYGAFASAIADVLGPAAVATTGSFGSSPGVGGNGGFPWATIPGREMFAGMPIASSYDWNENNSTLPLHSEALLDRLRSWGGPEKRLWALIDNFGNHLGRQARLRANALALTRCPESIGTTYLPHPSRGDLWTDIAEANAWVHALSGTAAGGSLRAPLRILYVNEQANLRGVAGPGANDDTLLHGSHEGKTTEALLISHAAGWPGAILTVDELQRSGGSALPGSTGCVAILLVGLPQFTPAYDWHWINGTVAGDLLPALQAFVAAGGVILSDADSMSSATPGALRGVPVMNTGMAVRAYTTESDKDVVGDLIGRNAANIAALRASLSGAISPSPLLVTSADERLWCIPTLTADVRYVSCLNFNNITVLPDGKTDDVQPMPSATVDWSAAALGVAPIYDMRTGAQLSLQSASSFNLTAFPFVLFGVPPASPSRVIASVRPPTAETVYYEALVSVASAAGGFIGGIPVEITVTATNSSANTATVWTSSPTSTYVNVSAVRLPLSLDDGPGTFTVTVTELMSRLTVTVPVVIPAADSTAGVDTSSTAGGTTTLLTTKGDAALPLQGQLGQGHHNLRAAAAAAALPLGYADDAEVDAQLQPMFSLAPRRAHERVFSRVFAGTNITVFGVADVAAFASGPTRNGPSGDRLVLALTPAQRGDAAISAAASALAAYYVDAGRTGVGEGTAAPANATYPDGVINALHAYNVAMRWPQWRSHPTDLLLLGAAKGVGGDARMLLNPLIYDLAHAHVLPVRTEDVPVGSAYISVIKSAFFHSRWTLAVVAPSVADLLAAMQFLSAAAA